MVKVEYVLAIAPQLRRITKYIGKFAGSKIADTIVERIIVCCEDLATFPMRGMPRNDLFPDMRFTNCEHGKAVIAYIFDPPTQTVTILCVAYGGQDIEALLGP